MSQGTKLVKGLTVAKPKVKEEEKRAQSRKEDRRLANTL